MKPLLDGPTAVASVIKRYVLNHSGKNPTKAEFCSICRELGNTQDEIDEYIDTAVVAGIVNYDESTDILTSIIGI